MTSSAREASTRPLTTDNDKVTRIRDLLATATHPAQLWVMTLDADGRQLPLLLPIEERPAVPDPAMIDTLIAAVSRLVREEYGEGFQAMFVLERLGAFGVTAADHCWAAALQGACDRMLVPCAGTFLLSPGGVSPVAP